jgi:signal peptidase II
MLVIALLIVVPDQVTKHAVRYSFAPGESVVIIPSLFDFTHVRNTGAVWGSFQGHNEWLAIVSIAVLAMIALFHQYLSGGRMVFAAALGFIMGGIIGNLVDRVKLGWVTDFLDFYWNTSHWPAFNIADSAICIGVGLYLLASLFPAITGLAGADDADKAAK